MDPNKRNNRFLNFTGSKQENRYSKELHEEYVKIDEKSFADNLVYAYGLSKLFNFHNSEDKLEGDWSSFLIDEAVVLAAITFIDPAEIENRFKSNNQKVFALNSLVKKQVYLGKCFHDIFDLAKRFDDWYLNLRVVENYINDDVIIRNEIANIISYKLSPVMNRFKGMVLGAKEKDTLNISYNFSFNSFSHLWEQDDVEPGKVFFTGKNKSERINHAAESLQLFFQEFYEAIIYIKQKAQDYLDQSLKRDNHFPEVALLLAFLDLYKYPQNLLNDLSKRYQEYYYRKILKQSEKKSLDSKTYLNFTLDNEVKKAFVPEGTEFIAGSDSTGKNILFKSDYDFEVNRAQLVQLNNMFLAKTGVSDGKSFLEHVENIYFNKLNVDRADEDKQQQLKSYPVFGENQKGKGESGRTMQNAEVGFSIASPALFLKEGKREVSLELTIRKDRYEDILENLRTYSNYLNISFKEMIVKSFLDAFKLQVTTSEGWMNIDRYVVAFDEKKNKIAIKFDVQPDKQAVVAYDSNIHKDGYSSRYPVLKLLLNNSSYIYPYFLLKSASLEQVTINTAVKGVKDLVIQNNVGQVNPDNPFFPFGPVPAVGSYLIVGSNEIFQKQLDNLTIHIDWFNMPSENQGFSSYYKEYKMGVDNTSYEANISILESGRWKPAEEKDKQVVKIFRSIGTENESSPEAKARLSDKLKLSNIKNIKQESDFKSIGINKPYNNLSKRGYIKIELSSPQDAFGHKIYPNIISDITLENSKTGFLKGKKKKALPNAPYTPTIKSLSIDYECSTTISVSSIKTPDVEVLEEHGQIYHIHPFGEEKVFPTATAKEINLVPSYDYEGALFLGYEDVEAPQTVSMLFEMLDEFTISSEEEPPEIEWSFLSNNAWYPIKQSNILRDDTNGFLKTGIIQVSIPGDINRNNTILPSDYSWLRVSVKANVEGASNLISVTSQVVKATLIGNDQLYKSDYLSNPLPPKTIQRSLKNLKGIKNVSQKLPSYEGKPFEDEKTFKSRVSERLRHRNRAVTAWDYEKLVLDQFPQIERATCLPNMNSNSLKSPGDVLIVVSPYPDLVINKKEPRASSEMLYEIKSYLKKFMSPFVSIEARNPSYERIRIICSVRFTESHNHGYYIQKLNENINEYLGGNMGGVSHGTLVGKAVYCSDVVTYIRTLPFIQFVTQFSIVQAARDITGNYILLDTAREGDEKDGLNATKPWSVLVPSSQHQITVLIDKKEEQSKQAGINYLELGGDFIISD